MGTRMLKTITQHTLISVVVVLVVVGGGYGLIKRWRTGTVPPSYVVAAAEKGTLITTVTGSGQVSVSNQVEVKAKASGDVVKVLVKEGQEVPATTLLAQLNAQDGYKAVRDAQANLDSARLSLTKIQQPPTAYELVQAQNQVESARTALEKLKASQPTDLSKAEQNKQKAADVLDKAYEDAYNTVSESFADLPTILSGLYTQLYSNEIGKSESSVGPSQSNDSALLNSVSYSDADNRNKIELFVDSSRNSYQSAKTAYEAALDLYKDTSRTSERSQIEALLQRTIDTTKKVSDTIKNETNTFNFWIEYRTARQQAIFAKVTAYQTALNGYTSQVSGNLSGLQSLQRTLQDNKEALINTQNDLQKMSINNPLDLAAAERQLSEKQASLANLQAGAQALDIKSAELTVTQRLNALLDAQQNLADYSVRAPFDGVVAKLSVKPGDTVSSNAGVATLIAKQQTAVISLNEVDVSKVSVGQKVTLTFDAVEGLTISGKVAEIDTLGTVTQGVVNYTVKIVFDTHDDRVKQGMSVSAAIITQVKQDVVLVPTSAIKTQGATTYVEQLTGGAEIQAGATITSAAAPVQKRVELGLSNDTQTEIVSGLTEGELIIARTIIPSAAKAATTAAPSLFGGTGGGRAGGFGGGAVGR